MTKRDQSMKVQVSLEVAQDAEEFIRKLVREEIEKCLQEKTQELRARAPHLTYERKGGWQR